MVSGASSLIGDDCIQHPGRTPAVFPNGPQVAVRDMFKAMGVQPFQLTAGSWRSATASSGIPWKMFFEEIGAASDSHLEWECITSSDKIERKKFFLCMDLMIQPFMPSVPGYPGLIVHPRDALLKFIEEDGKPFHVLTAAGRNKTLYYQGIYQRSRNPPQDLEWNEMNYKVMQDLFMIVRMSESNNIIVKEPGHVDQAF